MGTDTNDAVVARIEQLEAEGRALREEVRALRAEKDRPAAPEPANGDGPVTRRRLIGMAGAAAAGAVGGAVLAAAPAGAATNDPVLVDNAHTGTGTTSLTSDFTTGPALSISNTGAGGGANAITAVAGTGTGVSSTGASAGVSGSSTSGQGVTGSSSSGDGVRATSATAASVFVNAPTANTTGVHMTLNPGSTSGPPNAGLHAAGQFWMDSTSTLFQCTLGGTPGTWVQVPQLGRQQTLATSPVLTTKITGFPTGGDPILWAVNNNGGKGLVGQSPSGIGLVGSTDIGIGVQAAANAVNGVHLELSPTSQVGPPTGGTHALGQFYVDQNGVLFQCVVAGVGTAAKWARQASLVTLDSPFRIYDSRVGQSNPSGSTQGTLNFGAGPRTINCQPTPNFAGVNLPPTTSALLFNVTLANTVGGVGSVVVWANGASEPTTASITWTGSGVVVGNAVTSACDTSRVVHNKTTTGSSTHVILDVIGFYV